MPRFDRYVAVDWSAAASPRTGPDSIWVAVLDGGERPALSNPATRRAAERLLGDLTDAGRRRTLVAIDAALGYPVGTADRFGFGAPPWLATWSAIAGRLADDERNRNDRFELAAELNRRAGPGPGPFWGVPSRQASDVLTATKPAMSPLPELRATERELRARGWRPASVWQLLGAGSVGSQTLTVLPVLWRLRDAIGCRMTVWPFDAGPVAPPSSAGAVVVAEVWPTLFTGVDRALPDDARRPRDAAQVHTVALALREADRDGRLTTWFEPVLDAATIRVVTEEEGWVLGAPDVRPGGARRRA